MTAGTVAGDGTAPAPRRLTIGKVLAVLSEDFPDVTASKIRFLEAEGLVLPHRTASGYRTYTEDDVRRLHYVLTAQRDRYWPLKVIRDALDALDRGLSEPVDDAGGRPQPPAPSDDPEVPQPHELLPRRDISLTGPELREATASTARRCTPWKPTDCSSPTAAATSGTRRWPSRPLLARSPPTVSRRATSGPSARPPTARSAWWTRFSRPGGGAAPERTARPRSPLPASPCTSHSFGRDSLAEARPVVDRPGYGGGVREVDVLGVRVEMPTNQPIVLLRERDGGRYLPIWIGAAEAAAITYAQQGVVPPRPLTHDLMRDVLAVLGHELTEVRIVALKDSVFHAALIIDGKAEVSSRASDAIALALRTGAKVLVEPSILDEAAIVVSSEEDDEVERFKEFLDHVSAEDFEGPTPESQEPGDRPDLPDHPD